MKAAHRLLKYIKVYTTSDENSTSVPSAQREFDLANQLAEEMRNIGITDVRVTDTCYVYGEIPATAGKEQIPALGFISHMDTAPDFNGEAVNPQIIENYDGENVELGTSGRVLSPREFPHLAQLRGKTLITTDGTTLLGADDKAGIAEILTACETILQKICHMAVFALVLHRTKKLAAVPIILMFPALAPTLPTRLTVGIPAKSVMRISTLPVLNSLFQGLMCIPVTQRIL